MTQKSPFPINIPARQENEDMVEWVKFTRTDIDIIVEISQAVVDYKFRALSQKNWQIFEQEYLPKLIEQIDKNEFKVADPTNGVIPWLIDQIVHSRRVTEGLPQRDWMPLADTKLGESALEILRHAQRGSVSYNNYKHNQKFRDLFTDK